MELMRNRPLELFVDAREAVGAAVSVSDEWTRFFSQNRDHLAGVTVLVGSKLVERAWRRLFQAGLNDGPGPIELTPE